MQLYYSRLISLLTILVVTVVLFAGFTLAQAQSGAQLVFGPTTSTVRVGNSTTITVSLNSVSNLYGYQFQVNYDPARLDASGAFVDSFFDTSAGNAFVPGGWNAACSAGVCKFAATRLGPLSPLTGSGPLARIVFTGTAPGVVPLTFSGDVLGDKDGSPLTHTLGTGQITVYGNATITGFVQLQGRATPITTGTVTLTDTGALFSPTVVSFDASNGAFTATVPVDVSGSTYNALAAHSLYLSNLLTGIALTSGSTYNAGTTTLKGGDGNNDGTIDILDLACVGGGYNSSGTVCGTTGSSDINADGTVNIFDLVLVGGNYNLSSPQLW